MCNSKIKMVTPNKSKHYNKAGPGRQQAKTPSKFGGGHSRSKTPPSSMTNSTDLSFKTPQNSYFSKPRAEIIQQQRCKSEPKRGRSITPVTPSSSSPLTFAGPKCLEPPTPTSLPRPPTTWTRSDMICTAAAPSARQALSFDDLVGKPAFETIDPLSQQLKMLLKVQA